jgi:hypothetical protein
MLRIPPRGRHVTAEPQTIAEPLLGRDLATFRRRGAAIALDVVLFGLVTGALFLGLTAWSFHREDPTLFARAGRALGDDAAAVSQEEKDKVMADFYFMILERCPQAFPRDIADRVRARDLDGLRRHFRDVSSTIGLGAGKTRTIEGADGSHQVVIGLDLVMGPFAGVLGWGGLFVGWFTFWTLVTCGRSPAKAVLRLKIARLDGGRLNLWDCFSRAGGYSASAATLFLGFAEAIWHPNRQAIHDRIAGTVVLRG